MNKPNIPDTATHATPSEAPRTAGKIRLNVFRGARNKVPIAQDAYTWPELCAVLAEMCGDEADGGDPRAMKKTLLAVTFGHMREAYNKDANVEHLDALAIDVDRCDGDVLVERLAALDVAAFMYASPSDPNPDGSRRVRVIAPLSAPLLPEHVKHARHAFAELLGLAPGCGVENADAVSQIMFTGKLHGTPDRENWTFTGAPLDTSELVARPLVHAWPGKARKAKASAADAPDTRFDAEPDERTQALLVALEPYWEAPGEATGRRGVLRALGGYLARRGWPDEQIVAVARGLETERPERVRVATMLECAREARTSAGSAGWFTLVAWNAIAANAIENTAKDPREPEGWPGVWSEWWAGYLERRKTRKRPANTNENENENENEPAAAEHFAPAADTAEFEGPYILQARNDSAHVLLWDGADRGHQPVAVGTLRLCIAKQRLAKPKGPIALSVMVGEGEKKKEVKIPPQSIVEAHGMPFDHAVYDFSVRASRYEARTAQVIVGYPDACPEAAYDADADAWLRALGGKAYPRLEAWIASCSQAHITRLAAALVLLGPKDVGKTMFACAIAGMWGERIPPAATLIVSRFNGGLKNCPILVDEEAQLFGTKAISTKRFRDVTQSVERSVELKGRETFTLRGALRLVIPCNGVSDLRFTDVGGPEVIAAVSDRLCVIDAKPRAAECRAALERLRIPGGWLCDIARVTSHMAWLAETVALPVERFIGSGGDNADGAVLAGHTHETAELWATLEDWLDGAADGPWYAHAEHGLCVDPRALAAALEAMGRGWDLPRVNAALAPFRTGAHRPNNGEGKGRPRVAALNATRLADALDLDGEAVDALFSRLSAEAPQPRATRGKFAGFKKGG